MPPTYHRPLLSEVARLAKASVPVIFAYILQNSLQTVSVLFAARLSPESLATAAFSYMFAMSTGWLIALGGTTALDTLASSGFTGAADKTGLGVLLQRGIIVLSGFYAAVAVLWWNSEAVFRRLGQEEFVCVQSARFLRCLIPGGLGYIWFEALKRYLQAQEIYRASTYVLLITSPLNAVLNYLLIHSAGFGLYSAPVATGISYWLSFILLALYAAFVRGSECWGGLDVYHACQHVFPFARLAFLGIIHVGTEWWALEIVALSASKLGAIPLAAQSVIMTANQVINTIPFGIGVVVSARVGNQLGAKDACGAKREAHTAAALSIAVGTAVMLALAGTRHVFGRLFDRDEQVVVLVAQAMPLVALFQIADGLNGSCGGVLRGMGRQWVGATINIFSYYGISLPIGIHLAFHGYGLVGLWIGQCIALYLMGVLKWIIVSLSNWEKQVHKARKRLEAGGITSQPE
ncbi:hypothetical protein TD95_004912 [Thielaviopsis punctulata]|uniref:MATE efflux family protein n=1 Tax=Thielaviopsis punctulata TaxID=72032 RepID=A0A0F4ZGX8_9PEZI|nr:hypothetical protein TD95_004912 [Thielaviopsis punctulata]